MLSGGATEVRDMTDEQCGNCRFRSAVGGFPDGEDMFCCDMETDPRMPFDMEHDTECPCFEPVNER